MTGISTTSRQPSASVAVDQYERSAEFIDLMMASYWAGLKPVLTDALQGLPADVGPAVDIGAGGGLGTAVIGRAVPSIDIVAVEPSPALRAVLLSRVNHDPGLRDRVTVIADGFLEAALPTQWGAVVAMNVIGHFSPRQRSEIWALLGQRLDRRGRAVVNLQSPHEPGVVPPFRAAEVRLGRRRYEGWGRAEPAGETGVTWHMTYRVFQDGELVQEVEAAYPWEVLGEQRLRSEVGKHGLTLTPTGPGDLGMYVITPASKRPA